MTRKILLLTISLLLGLTVNAQKAQRIGYIDMDYILENIPEYTEAQAKINAKGITWQNDIEKQQKGIDGLIADLENEKALLTKDLIAEKEEDIQIKELELKKLQSAYFGTKGDIYFLRQQLVQPIQDLVFNAVQDIAKKRKYDFVLNKSSDLIMLYTNKKFDISDLVIKSITRTKKEDEIKSKQTKRKADIEAKANKEVVPNAVLAKKVSDREAKQLELNKKKEEKKAAQIKKREELKKAIEAKRLKRIQKIEEAKAAKLKKVKEIEEQKNKNNN